MLPRRYRYHDRPGTVTRYYDRYRYIYCDGVNILTVLISFLCRNLDYRDNFFRVFLNKDELRDLRKTP